LGRGRAGWSPLRASSSQAIQPFGIHKQLISRSLHEVDIVVQRARSEKTWILRSSLFRFRQFPPAPGKSESIPTNGISCRTSTGCRMDGDQPPECRLCARSHQRCRPRSRPTSSAAPLFSGVTSMRFKFARQIAKFGFAEPVRSDIPPGRWLRGPGWPNPVPRRSVDRPVLPESQR
jgi:hypothetical protein